ncbi:MAG TPA: dihydrodipicolinate synthase family protein [bacterium]|nr:dihydrodipicolinate synthase family protein [bacterium]
MSSKIHDERRDLVKRTFPEGIARLWCPPLTHYRHDASLDTERIQAHIRALAPCIGGLLVPGSTGDGWDLSRAQKLELLDTVLPLAAGLGLPVLVGALERTTDDMLDFIRALGRRATEDPVVGIVACAPSGVEQSEAAIEASFERILELGLPTAIYQLPQVTGNEISAATTGRLASRFPNFFMLKDSSGEDHIALANVDPGGVFLVRGAELGYSGWLKPRGPYDGFLLSTANWLAPRLASIAAGTGTVRIDEAVDAAVAGAFELVPGYPTGNAFGNSATLMDHVLAFGDKAAAVPGPFSRDGRPFPRELVEQAARLMQKNGLMPSAGYLQT